MVFFYIFRSTHLQLQSLFWFQSAPKDVKKASFLPLQIFKALVCRLDIATRIYTNLLTKLNHSLSEIAREMFQLSLIRIR